MIPGFNTPSSRTALALACALAFPALCSAQRQEVIPDNVPPPAVYVNPRAGADDPRIGLKAGITDAGEAAMGLKRVVSLGKPAIFDPPPPPPVPGPPVNGRNAGNGLTYANSDMAFGGKHLFVGNFYGITFYDIADPAKLKLITTLVCPGGQGDVSVYGHLLFMSVEGGGRTDCGTQPFPTPARPVGLPPATAGAPGEAPADPAAPRVPRARPVQVASPDRARGVRIFDISDLTHPKQVAMVQTCRGSHTHTLLVDPNDKDDIYVYVAGSAGVRPAAELAGCSGGEPSDDPNTALFTIVVIKVPLAHPELAKVVNSPRIFSDPQTGAMNGLKSAGVHGATNTPDTRGCHDLTTYAALGLMAGACSGNGILLDIKDPVHPRRTEAVSDSNFAFWHTATFSNDGTKVVFTDEWGGGTQPRCRATDPMHWGADAIFSLKGSTLTLDSYYKMPAPQTEVENCVAHNGSLLPIPGRDILVQGWYQGGISIMDFTDPKHPYEMAYFDRGPLDAQHMITGGFWSGYWYNGYVYGSEIARGVDVFKLVPTKYLTQNEIDAGNQVHFDELNVQAQPKIVYPQTLITAKAYMDQLVRSNALTAEKAKMMDAAIDGKKTREMKSFAATLDKDAPAAKPDDMAKMQMLAAILKR
jgi:hypothetical protein